MEEALQWWHAKKIGQWSSEANLIRERLLQQSFVLRRSLELSSDKLGPCTVPNRRHLKQLEDFHSSLKQLSDRLFPSSLNEGLPYAIEQSTQKWQQSLGYQFRLNLAPDWMSAAPTADFIILGVLEDLLRIQAEKKLSNNLVVIDLKQNIFDGKINHELKVVLAVNEAPDNERELEYLQQIFRCLASGTCQNVVAGDSNIWLFNW